MKLFLFIIFFVVDFYSSFGHKVLDITLEKTDKVNIIFENGFQNAICTLILNDSMFFKGKISTNVSIGYATGFALDKNKRNLLTLIVSGQQKKVKFGKRINFISVTYKNGRLRIYKRRKNPIWKNGID